MKPLQRKTYDISQIIMYEDRNILVCHKPAGLPVQTKNLTQKDLESILKTHLAPKTDIKEAPYLAVINRLDQPVEGLVLFAKTPKAASNLTKQLTSNQMVKEYLAITSALPIKSAQTLTDYLVKDGKSNLSKVVNSSVKEAKKAILDYKVVTNNGKHALLQIFLKTGRHHQIRVQMANMGTPLLGDKKYGGKSAENLCLCAWHLAFQHPITLENLNFSVQPQNPEFSSYLPIDTTV